MGASLDLSLPDGPIGAIYADFRDNEDFMESAWAGGYNLGKTTAMVDGMIQDGLSYPGAEIILARKYGTMLRATTLVTLERRAGLLFTPKVGGSANKNYGEYRFPPAPDPMNPGQTVQSIIRAVGLDEADIDDKMGSRQPFRINLEEGDEMEETVHNTSLLRCRQKVYHREKKVRHKVAYLARKWGLSFAEAQRYMGVADDELERPMQGLIGLRTIWNPKSNDHLWKRYVGVPYPDEGVTLEWARKNIGIREEHIPPEEHQDPLRRYQFLPDNTVIHKGVRRTVGRQDEEGVHLLPRVGHEAQVVSPKELTLVMQRAMRYAWPWMNKSGNKDNHAASFLITDKDMAKKFFAGKIDVKSGLVTPQFNPAPVHARGHVCPAPSLSDLKGLRAIGAVDHGGRHYTAAVIFAITHDDRLVAVREYIQDQLSASQNAYNIAAMVPPDMDVTWYCDPSMNRIAYESDELRTAIEAYATAGIMLEPAPAKGDGAIDVVRDMLVFKNDMIGGSRKSQVYVSDACEHLIETLSEITWKDLAIRRNKWQVDMFDAFKYGLAGKYHVRKDASNDTVTRGRPQTPSFRPPPQQRYRTWN